MSKFFYLNRLNKIGEKMNCNLCQEISLQIGEKGQYGAPVICKIGNQESGWFATLSPKTGGNPEKDFTIQIMTFKHLTHFSEMDDETAKNYGLIFKKISKAMHTILQEEIPNFQDPSETRELAVSLATYGKATTWNEKKEHLHLKIYPFRGKHGQPSTVDSTWGRQPVHEDEEGKFIKMEPIEKVRISKERVNSLSKRFIEILSNF